MVKERKIKVVKNRDRERAAQPAPPPEVKRDPSRDMIRTISGWVRESQRRRQTEGMGLRSLLPLVPRTNEG
jgi:hypothetical protein